MKIYSLFKPQHGNHRLNAFNLPDKIHGSFVHVGITGGIKIRITTEDKIVHGIETFMRVWFRFARSVSYPSLFPMFLSGTRMRKRHYYTWNKSTGKDESMFGIEYLFDNYTYYSNKHMETNETIW